MRYWLAIAAGALALLVGPGYCALGVPGDLDVVMLNMGQGDCFLIELPSGKKMLVDGGHQRAQSSPFTNLYTFLSGPYKQELQTGDGRIHIDAVIITHPDADHFIDLLPLLRSPRVCIERVYHNGLAEASASSGPTGRLRFGFNPSLSQLGALSEAQLKQYDPGYRELLQAVRVGATHGTAVFAQLARGDEALLANVLPPQAGGKALGVSILNLPRSNATYGYATSDTEASKVINGNSITIRLRWGQFEALLAGDLNENSEADVVKTFGPGALACDLLKVPHHGSKDFSAEFLRAARCMVAFVSSDPSYPAGRPWNHPRWECLCEVLWGHLARLGHPPSAAVAPINPAQWPAHSIYATGYLKRDVMLTTDGTKMTVAVPGLAAVTYPCD